MISLFTTLYNENESDRKRELVFSINNNLKNALIDRIFILNESDEKIENNKIINIKIDRRPTFNDFFSVINKNSVSDDINIIANTDISFDDSLKLLNKYKNKNIVLALTRWNKVNEELKLQKTLFYSQDTWIFFGMTRKINGDFNIGKAGCDNRLAFEIRKAGYKVYNPSLSIVTTHHHRIGFREDYPESTYDRVPLPYYYPLPTISSYDKRIFDRHKIRYQYNVIIYWLKKIYINKQYSFYRKKRRDLINFLRRL